MWRHANAITAYVVASGYGIRLVDMDDDTGTLRAALIGL